VTEAAGAIPNISSSDSIAFRRIAASFCGFVFCNALSNFDLYVRINHQYI
jgi:hypothetical protein